MRAKEVIVALRDELENKQQVILLLMEQNERLTRAALASANPAGAAQLRKPREPVEKPEPVIPIGM